MQAVRANEATVTPRLMRIILLRVADKCILHTSLKTSRFSLISCHKRVPSYLLKTLPFTTGAAAHSWMDHTFVKSGRISRVCRSQNCLAEHLLDKVNSTLLNPTHTIAESQRAY